MRYQSRLPGLSILLVAAACGSDDGTTVVIPPATIDSVAVLANPNMVVSALIELEGSGDSAYVLYRVAGAATDSITPRFGHGTGLDTLPVLGLLPATGYEFRVVLLRNGGDSAMSGALALTTGALPAALPAYATSGPAPRAGFVTFGAGAFGLVIDHTGRVVWYKEFPIGGPGLNFMAEPIGRYVGRSPTADPNDDDPMLEVDAAGFDRRPLRCLSGRHLRFHDMLVAADSSYWIMCDDTRTMDLTATGGKPAAVVTGTTLQHVSAAGTLLFEWNPFDHFLITDLDSLDRIGNAVNWTHGNSFELDTDGNILLSFRSLSEVTKINATTGAVIWRMGGRRNQFTFAGPAETGFFRQHNVRAAGPNRFIVLDNNGGAISRFERYLVNTATMTATLEQAYLSSPGVLTLIGGSVQQEASDRYLVSFGTEGRVEEFDLNGVMQWRISGNPGYVFRAQRIQSLYHPVPTGTR